MAQMSAWSGFSFLSQKEQKDMNKLYEIYLDESGNFERYSSHDGNGSQLKKEVSLIGGVVVPPELKEKEGTLYASMQDIRKEFFPNNERITEIHLSELKGDTNYQCRKKLLTLFKEHMKGVQIIFVYDVSPLGATSLPGAQYYRNMLLKLMQTIIFYHPSFARDDRFQVNVAHRRITYPAAFDKSLASQGYLKLKDHRGRTQFTAITQAELVTIMDLLQNNLRFVSERKASFKILPYKEWDNPFMVMADCLCNTFYGFFDNNGPDRALKLIKKEFHEDCFLFFCPLDYELPERALNSYFQGNYGEVLSQVHRVDLRSQSNFLLLYPAVNNSREGLAKLDQPQECGKLLEVADRLLNQKNFSMISKIKELHSIAQCNISSLTNPPADLLLLAHDVGLRYHNHSGHVKGAIFHRDKGYQVFKQLGIQEIKQMRKHHNFLNRASVIDTNEFAFERAIARLQPIMKAEESITEVFGPDVQNEILGKIYGSVAQNYAFLQDKEMADNYFQKAAFHLDQPGRPSSQQIAYRAHFALDRKDWVNYSKEICSLFEFDSFPGFQETARRCLDNLPDTPYDFYIHLILKGMYVFPEKDNVADQAESIFKEIRSRGIFDEISEQHPWELVLIALGNILVISNKKEQAEQCWRAAAEFVKDEEKLTFILLSHLARALQGQVACMNGEDKEHIFQTLLPVKLTFQNFEAHDLYPGVFNPHQKPDHDNVVRAGWFDHIGRQFIDHLDRADLDKLSYLCSQFIKRFTFNYW
jgi:hypothetical protein